MSGDGFRQQWLKNIRSVKGETEEGTCRDGEG